MKARVERFRYSVDDYHRMAKAGILGEDDRVELLDGEIAMMTPIGRRHAACVDRLNRLLVRRCGDEAIVRVQNPIVLSEDSEPEPDLALLRPRDDFYASAHPRPKDVLLVIEVADSSVEYDRQTKLPIYARSGISHTWIIDLGRNAIDAYEEPAPEGYAVRRTFSRGDSIRLEEPALDLEISEILPATG